MEWFNKSPVLQDTLEPFIDNRTMFNLTNDRLEQSTLAADIPALNPMTEPAIGDQDLFQLMSQIAEQANSTTR